jgi:hypothetical protein
VWLRFSGSSGEAVTEQANTSLPCLHQLLTQKGNRRKSETPVFLGRGAESAAKVAIEVLRVFCTTLVSTTKGREAAFF